MRPSGKNWQSDRSVMMECTGSVYSQCTVWLAVQQRITTEIREKLGPGPG